MEWRTTDVPLDSIEQWLYHIRHYPLLTPQMERALSKAEGELMRACFLYSDPKGLYRPSRT
jgi:hypothetical protein